MSLSNNELLQILWDNQILIVSENIVKSTYKGYFFNKSLELTCFQSVAERRDMTRSLTASELIERMRHFADYGFIRRNNGKHFLAFYIPGQTSMALYKDAMQWWKDNGFSKDMKLSGEQFNRLQGECYNYLMEKYSSKAPNYDEAIAA